MPPAIATPNLQPRLDADPVGLRPDLRKAILWTGGALVAAGALGPVLLGDTSQLTTFFFKAQDAPVLALSGVVLMLLAVFSGAGSARPGGDWESRRARLAAPAASLFAFAAALAGTYAVFRNYPLSLDEVMADFDAAILRTGRLAAAVPAEWRPYAGALQPYFRLPVPGDVAWISSYLPGNAALRALVSLALPMQWTGPLLAAVSVIATAAIARRLWPDRPDAAVVAALLIATSRRSCSPR